MNSTIIDRYLENRCSPEEKQSVEQWYLSFEQNANGLSTLNDEDQLKIENELFLKIKAKIAPKRNKWLWHYSGAAAVLVLSLGIYTYNEGKNDLQAKSGVPFSGWAKYENVSAKTLNVTLPDGSAVLLQPKSNLAYNQSDAQFREIELSGEAFFDVKPDAERPFYIYTKTMTTKVLGTSFNVKAYPDMGKAEVSVKTGKVTVYEKDKQNKGVVLSPNLKVTYFEKDQHFVTGIVEKPEVLLTENKEIDFDFQDTALIEVLHTLSEAYGLDIILENQSLNLCTLNGNLKDMPLYTKLDVITQSLSASYEIKGTTILITGQGCN